MVAQPLSFNALVETSPTDATRAPEILLVAALCFNAVLAAVNGHVIALKSSAVIISEVIIVGAANIVALSKYRREMNTWYALAGILVLIALFRSLVTEEIAIKFLRDVILMPTFVVLGMAVNLQQLRRAVLVVHAVVVGVLLLEAIDVALYAEILKIRDYYINTRDFNPSDFWDKSSDLFISATRPEERVFNFLNLHRMSSIFLEPVSLGNYCITITAFLCACWESLRGPTRWFLIAGNVLAILGCDGRLATTSSLVIIPASLLAAKLPRHANFVYLPAITILLILAANIADLKPGADTFAGRVASTVALLSQFELTDFLGTSGQYVGQSADSGIAYFISTQSIIGVGVIWLFIVYGSYAERSSQTRYNHGFCLSMALSLMISFSMFSIKTAALLCFIHGALQRRQFGDEI